MLTDRAAQWRNICLKIWVHGGGTDPAASWLHGGDG